MCFVPKVSLATALIEFFVAGWIYFNFPKRVLTSFFAIVIFLLGFYQFTEFMLCTTGNARLWGKIGFITHSLIPAICLYSIMLLVSYKPKKLIIF